MQIRITVTTEVTDSLGNLKESVTSAGEWSHGDNPKFIREMWSTTEERNRLLSRHVDAVAAGLGEK